MNMVRWAPWRRYKDAVEADGELPEGVPVEEQKSGSGMPKTVFVETKSRPPREFYISQKNRRNVKGGFSWLFFFIFFVIWTLGVVGACRLTCVVFPCWLGLVCCMHCVLHVACAQLYR